MEDYRTLSSSVLTEERIILFRMRILPLVILFACATSPPPAAAPSTSLPIDRIILPPGFSIEVFAEGIENARSMALAPDGTLYVGTRTAGKVYSVRDGRVTVIAEGLNMPNGIAYHDGALYVGEVHRVRRLRDGEWETIRDDLPREKHHGWRYMNFGPDGKLYIAIGAPCNVCLRDDERFASIARMNPDGSEFEIFAHGIRNSVGFDWDASGELWFTDNGRDLMGDDIPPDELNHAPRADLHFGFPFVHGKGVRDPKFFEARDSVPPVVELGPHVAALGMVFYDGDMFPREYRNQIFIAEHGSWNRSTKIGYRVALVRDGATYEPFATGWLSEDGKVWGRPAALLVMPDGSLLLSDDHADAIYRIRYDS